MTYTTLEKMIISPVNLGCHESMRYGLFHDKKKLLSSELWWYSSVYLFFSVILWMLYLWWFALTLVLQIFWSLRNILGRAVPVGNENLTWTLMKYIKPDSHDHEAPHNEFLMESYSKLNIALSVMHECFEPVKEPHTRRDLMEDVIFSRWWDPVYMTFFSPPC